jgi:RHS repeat-associated protein
MKAAVVLAGLAGCLSDDATSRLTESAVALPPGGIIDTQPFSGWTEGTFSVDHNGAAEYHLPLWVPDGRGDLQPDVALHYNSQAGNGLVGVGWSLTGFSSIAPCPRTLNQDGRVENVSFLGLDAYCLDGQRLHVARPADGGTEFRTEEDTFARVIGYSSDPLNQPDQFKVWTKDGRILTFGGDANAKQRPYALTGVQPESPAFHRTGRVTASWALNKIEDRNGNAINISYLSGDTDDGHWFVPHQITYGPDRAILLEYEIRTDRVSRFKPGRFFSVQSMVDWRPKAIKMFASSKLVREYRLRYENNSITGLSLLASVTECDAGGETQVCLNPLEFDWSLGSVDFDVVDTDITDVGTRFSPRERRGYLVLDIDGDASDDLLYIDPENNWKLRFSNGANGFGPAHDTHYGHPPGEPHRRPWGRAIDYDRDYRSDAILEASHDNGSFPQIVSSNGTSLQFDENSYAFYRPGMEIGLYSALFGDLDGDARPELIAALVEPVPAAGSSLRWRYYHNVSDPEHGRGNRLYGPNDLELVTPGPDGEPGNPSIFDHRFQLRVTSFDGIASQILAWDQPGERYQALRFVDGSLVASPINLPFTKLPENQYDDRRNLHFADVNGDGLADAVYPYSGLTYQLSSGSGFSRIFGPGTDEYVTPEPVSWERDLSVRIADFNGDGADDVLILHPGTPTGDADYAHGLQLYTWGGSGFIRTPVNHAAVPFDLTNTQAVQPLDIDGDGLLDIAQIWKTSPDGPESLRILRRRPEARTGNGHSHVPDKLVRVRVAGLGKRVEVTYTTLGQHPVTAHAPCETAYPLICPRRGGSIVGSHTVENLDGSSGRQFVHRYRGARIDVRGRGWLGFEKHTVDDFEKFVSTSTEFDNKSKVDLVTPSGTVTVYPYAGRPKQVHEVAYVPLLGTELHRRSTTLSNVARPGATAGTYVVELDAEETTTREDLDRNGVWQGLHRSRRELDYDEFGNPTRISTTALEPEGPPTPFSRRVDEVTYLNDADDSWLIGQLDVQRTTDCTNLERPDEECVVRTTKYDYDDATGNLTDVIVEPEDHELLLRTHVVYGGYGNISSVTQSNAAGEERTTSLNYDDRGLYPTETSNALGHTKKVAIEGALGVALETRDENDVPTTMKYDRFGRLREVNRADGSFERFNTFGPLLHFTVVPNGDGGTVTREFVLADQLGRPIRNDVLALDGTYDRVVTTYDGVGRVEAVSRPFKSTLEPEFATRYQYDQLDRIVKVEQPDGTEILHVYQGLEAHTIDARGTESYVKYRIDGRIGWQFEDDPKSPDWLQTSFEYKPFGLIGKVVAPDGTAQSMDYDKLGRRVRHVDPSAGTTTQAYNAFGELRHETNGNGEQTHVQIHDLLGRPWRISSPDGLTTFNWDKPGALGKLDVSTQQDTNGHYVINRFTYDDVGRNTRTSWQIDGGSIFALDVGFDGVGRLSSITYPRIPVESEAVAPPRFKVRYGYLASGHLDAVTDASSGELYWQASAREPDGQLAQETYGNGVIATREYFPETGLLRAMRTDGPAAPLGEIAYDYDRNRNVTLREEMVGDLGRVQTYDYDRLDRLVTWTHSRSDGADLVTSDFDYDSVGNLRSETVAGRTGRDVTYGYGENGAPRHVLTSRNRQRYTHDRAGRRTAGAGLAQVIYNRRDLPLLIRRGSGGSSEFAYDAAGARVFKRTDDYTRFSIAGLFERTIGDRTRNVHNVMAEGREVAQVTLTQEAPNGPVDDTDIRYLHHDRQDSTVLVTNEAGTRVAELFYDPFGRRTDRDYDPLSGTVAVRPGYGGHRHDDELDLIDMGGRIYDQSTRRFLSADPFVQEPLLSQSYNRYSYVRNNPATLIDPSGFQSEDLDPCWLWCPFGDSNAPGEGGGSGAGGGQVAGGQTTSEPLRDGRASQSQTTSTDDANQTNGPHGPGGGRGSGGGPGGGPRSGGGASGPNLFGSPNDRSDDCMTIEGCSPSSYEVGRGYLRDGPISPTENLVVGLISGGLIVATVAPELAPILFGSLARSSTVVASTGSAGAFAEGGRRTWQQFLPEASRRLQAAVQRYGDYGLQAMGIGRQKALQHIETLVPHIETHLAKIAAEPLSQAVGHWRTEVRAALGVMERMLPHIGKKTAAEWGPRIAEWWTRIGE